MVGEDYPSDWNKRRLVLFDRYNWTCQSCNDVFSKESSEELHAHHVRPISEGGGHSLDNLLPLCRECHREVHSTDQWPDLLPRERYECSYCNEFYIEGTGADGSYCSKYCSYTHKAEKQVTNFHSTERVCSTCFAEFPRHVELCPNCGNWDANQNNLDAIDDVEIDMVNAIRRVINIYDK